MLKTKSLWTAFFSALFLFTGCSVREAYVERHFRLMSPVYELEESDMDSFFADKHYYPIVSRDDRNDTVMGYVVFPSKASGASGYVYQIVGGKKNKMGRWEILECETNSSIIMGVISERKDSLGNVTRFLSLPAGKCLKIVTKERISDSGEISDDDFF